MANVQLHCALLIIIGLMAFGTSSSALYMEEEVFLEKGSRGLVPCKTDLDAVIVFWSFDPPPVRTPLVILDYYNGVWTKGGPGYANGRFDIDKNFTMIIKNVRVEDGATYYCSVGVIGTGSVFNSTTVNVFSTPRSPFPSIMACQNKTAIGDDCSVTTEHHIDITCAVYEYFPIIRLYFRHQSRNIINISSSKWNNTDLTLNKALTIRAVPSADPYICVASDIPGHDDPEEIATIYVNATQHGGTTHDSVDMVTTQAGDHRETSIVRIIVPMIILCMAAVVTLQICLWWYRKKRQQGGNNPGSAQEQVLLVDIEDCQIEKMKAHAVSTVPLLQFPETNGTDISLTSEEVDKLRDALKQFYRDIFVEIKTSPLDHKSGRKLDQIYVNLILKKDDTDNEDDNDGGDETSGNNEEANTSKIDDEDNYDYRCYESSSNNDETVSSITDYDYTDTNRKHIDYNKIAKIIKIELGKTRGKSRMAFLGDAGVGKTTLLGKIAYDWAVGNHLPDIDLLFFVPLRVIQTCARIADIPKSCVPRTISIKSRQLEKYIRENQSSVMFLLDGLNEYHGEIKKADPADALHGIVRGDDLQKTPVLVTTRSWRAEANTNVNHINKRYMRVCVEGFQKQDVELYIRKFFDTDAVSADSLIQLVTEDSLVAQHMAPFPIYCSMLCHIWTDESRRKAIQTLNTFAQLFDEMIDTLNKQWHSKDTLINSLKRANDSLINIGGKALEGLLTEQLFFTVNEFEKSPDYLVTGCEIGVLKSEKRFEEQHTDIKQHMMNVSFPHKLFQEYSAGLYLASMYDTDRVQFTKLLKDTILPEYEGFRYLLYFTASHGKRLGNAGKALMESLCAEVKDHSFIVDVAFECHDEAAIAPVVELFRQKEGWKLVGSYSQHTKSGFVFSWSMCSRNLIISVPQLKDDLRDEHDTIESSYAAGVGLFTLPKLRSLELWRVEFDDSFYRGMAAAAKHSQIQELTVSSLTLNPEASRLCGNAVSSMTKLTSLHLSDMNIDDGFFQIMSESSSTVTIEAFTIKTYVMQTWDASGQCARALFSMTKLRSVLLLKIELDDEFFSVMAELASGSQIQALTFPTLILGPETSKQFATGLFTMPKLRSFDLTNISFDDSFFLVMSELGPRSQINALTSPSLTLGPETSKHFATGLFTMPKLRAVNLRNISFDDSFFLVMSELGPRSQLENIQFPRLNLGPEASRQFVTGLCIMPKLRTLKLDKMRLDEEFYRGMSKQGHLSQIWGMTLICLTLKPESSRLFGKAVSSMTKLTSLVLCDMQINDRFFKILSESSSTAMIEMITISRVSRYKARVSCASGQCARALFSMTNLRSVKLEDIEIDDQFFSVMAELASGSQIQALTFLKLTLGPETSKQFATGLFTMPKLRAVDMRNVSLDDSFVPVMTELGPRSQLENIDFPCLNLGPDESRQFATGVFTMQKLRTLELDSRKMVLDEEFYRAMSEQGHLSQIQELTLRLLTLSPEASRLCGKAVSSMTKLTSLHLCDMEIDDGFFQVLLKSSSTVMIETFTIRTEDMDTDNVSCASGQCARALFSMTNLRSVKLERIYIDEEFFSVMAELASGSQIEELVFTSMEFGPVASEHCAKGLSAMPKLRSLTQNSMTHTMESILADRAHVTQIERLSHSDGFLNAEESHMFAKFVCTLPNLLWLDLVKITMQESFFSIMRELVPFMKLQHLSLNTFKLSRSRLHAFMALPLLQTIFLHNITRLDSATAQDEDSMTCTKVSCKESAVEVSVDDVSLSVLCELGLPAACPNVQKLELVCYEDVAPYTIRTVYSPFSKITEVQIKGFYIGYGPWPTIRDSASFCNALVSSCPQLIKLSLTDLKLRNDTAADILRGTAVLQHLKSITIRECYTDQRLDDLCEEIRNERNIDVTVVHNK